MRHIKTNLWRGEGIVVKTILLAALAMSGVMVGCGGGDSGAGSNTQALPGTGSFSFTDNFSGTRLNEANWENVEGAIRVVFGALRMAISSNTLDLKRFRVRPTNGVAVNQVGATVTMNGYTNPNTATAQELWLAGARVFWFVYNDGQSAAAGDMTGDVNAQIRFIGDKVGYGIFKCGDPTCSTDSAISGDANNPFVEIGAITKGTAYPTDIAFDSIAKTLTFSVQGLTPVVHTIADATVAPPVNAFYTLEVKSSGVSGTWVDATYDDVLVDGALYDDFAATSLDPAKWKEREKTGEVASGVANTYAVADHVSGNQEVSFRTLPTLPNKQSIVGSINVQSANVTIGGTGTVEAQSFVTLRYRPVAARTSGDLTDHFEFRAGVQNKGAGLVPFLSMYGCADISCTTTHTLPAWVTSGQATLTVGTPVVVSVEYDHATKVATVKVGTQIASVDLSTVSGFNPANFWQGGLYTRVRMAGTAPGDSGSIAATFDDVTFGQP